MNILSKIKINHDIANKTWFGTGGKCKIYFSPDCVKELSFFLKILPKNTPVFGLGLGSNVIVRDGGFNGAIIKLGNGFKYHYLNENKIPWGIITNKPRKYSELLLAQIDWPDQVAPQVLVTPCDVTNPKPDAEPMHLALNQLNSDAKVSWYIGDHKRDIDAAHNANMISVAAAYGYIHEEDSIESWKPNYIIEKADDLIALLKAHL